MEFQEVLYTRRSCRSYTGEGITEEQLHAILTAATMAPSACNMQSWHFTAFCGREAIQKVYPMVCRQEWIQDCAVILVVSTDGEGIEKRAGERGRNVYSVQDTACAMENILLTATDLGLGGCFIGAFDEAAARDICGLGDRYRPVALAAIGVPTGIPASRPRKPLAEVVTIVGSCTKAY